MSNGEIKDWQITSSSTYPHLWDPDCHEKYSRLYLDNGKSWCAKHRSDSEWLQIDLGVAAKVILFKKRFTIISILISKKFYNFKYFLSKDNRSYFTGTNRKTRMGYFIYDFL